MPPFLFIGKDKQMDYTINRNGTGRITIVQQIDPRTDEVLNEFYSVRKAANALGFPSLFSNVAKACREGSIVKGYRWQYLKL